MHFTYWTIWQLSLHARFISGIQILNRRKSEKLSSWLKLFLYITDAFCAKSVDDEDDGCWTFFVTRASSKLYCWGERATASDVFNIALARLLSDKSIEEKEALIDNVFALTTNKKEAGCERSSGSLYNFSSSHTYVQALSSIHYLDYYYPPFLLRIWDISPRTHRSSETLHYFHCHILQLTSIFSWMKY